MASSNPTNWAKWLSDGTITSSAPFRVFMENDTWVAKDLPLSTHGAFHVQPSLTSDRRPKRVTDWAMWGTATIENESVESLQSKVDWYRDPVLGALTSFDCTGKETGKWHPASSVTVHHVPVKCKVVYDGGKRTDDTEFALTLTPLYYVPSA